MRLALERRTITVYLSPEDHTALKDQSRQAGLSLPQYIRTRCGLPVRWVSMPGTDDRDREEDEGYVILRELGLPADDYFESDGPISVCTGIVARPRSLSGVTQPSGV